MSGILLTKYKEEFIADFARRKSFLEPTVRNDPIDRGGQMIYLIAGDGGRSTVTRGANGLIPPSDDVQSNVTVTLNEDIDFAEKTSFNIFTVQGNQLDIMRMNSMGVIMRKKDARIIAALETGSVSLGTFASMTKALANKIAVTLGNAEVGLDDHGSDMFVVVTPAAWAELTDITSFANADYVNFGGESPVESGLPSLGRFKNWMGLNWGMHTGLTGKGTSTATCLAWHKQAIGYATSPRGIDPAAGYDDKQDTSWRRTTIFHGAVKLFNSAIVKFTHDDTTVLA
jgi:hypothetical protein